MSDQEVGGAPSVELREYFEALREADIRLADERDRRYTEIMAERDRAEELRAASLAAAVEAQTDTIKPLVEYVAGERGSRQGGIDQRQIIAWTIAAAATIWGLVLTFGNGGF